MKYNKNETMQMLGHQYIFPLFECEDVVKQYREAFKAIKEEHPLMNEIECIDLFMLGYIWGKRTERAKRKKVAK